MGEGLVPCRVAITGLGGVGRAAARLMLARRAHYRAAYGVDVRLVMVARSRGGRHDEAGLGAAQLDTMTMGPVTPEALAACRPDVLIEAGPSDWRGGGPGLAYLRAVLAQGCDAIVISKGALVHDGRALRAMADRSGALLRVSCATGAALPSIDLIDHHLKGCTVLGLEGILNVTTNVLLDTMMARGIGFAQALGEAQLAGFAEADPHDDADGWDTACKLLILANFALGADLAMEDVDVAGIAHVEAGDLRAWREQGLTPRLVGRLWREGTAWRAQVGLRACRGDDLFAHVAGRNKAIRLATGEMGEVTAMGCGPEPEATAACALKDLEHILAARHGR